jgi:phosphoribosyl 1,2-cyclic phosphate phosphodiesterase
MKGIFIGTGTSQGIPVIACKCEVCKSENSKDFRYRTSFFVKSEKTSIVIDTGPDFRMQMLNNKIEKLDGVVFTHEHKDHVAGLDDIRAYNYIQKKDMDVFASEQVQIALHREFPYVFDENKYPGVPRVKLHLINDERFSIGDICLTPINVSHYIMPVKAYRIGSLSYITDAKEISPSEMDKIRGSEVLILNALRKTEHISHFSLAQALEIIKEINPRKAYLTHISHLMGLHDEVSKELPSNVEIAYDGLEIEFSG